MKYRLIFYRGNKRIGHVDDVETILHLNTPDHCLVVANGKLLVPGRGLPEGATFIRVWTEIA